MLLHSNRTLSRARAGALIALFAMVSGCTFWHNFSTYFNTVYLANTHVEAYEAEQRAIVPANPNASIAVLNHRWIDEEYLMHREGLRTGTVDPITPSFSQSLSATKEIKDVHLDSAIILGSKVLADKKPNKYKEDALFIVGKAQFYKNDFIGAERKFHELLANYPQTKYGTQTRVFLARAMMLNHHIDSSALDLEREVASTTDPAAASSLHRAIAELIYAERPDSLSGIANELHLAENGLSGEDLARLAYQEGIVYYINADWPNAERAFRLAANSSSDDWLIGESFIADALARRETGDFDGARKELHSVLDHVKYGSSQAAARYELAYTDELAARSAVAGDLHSKEFRQNYAWQLHQEYFSLDTMYRNTSALIISRAKFRQAEIYRGMGNYDSAAKTAAPLMGTKDFSSPAMNEYVTNRASSLASYAKWRQELSHVDSLRVAVVQSIKSHGKTANTAPAENTDLAKIHLQALQEVLGARWNPATPVTLTKADSERLAETEIRIKGRQPARIVIADTTRYLDSLQLVAATAHYEIGRAYETFGETSDARNEYRMSDTMAIGPIDTGRTALRAQNLYAWVELESQQKNTSVRDSLLHILLTHYGETIYAQEARILYGRNDKNSPGELAYAAAYSTLRQGGMDAAKPKFLAVVSQFPEEDVAPRSLYALGVSYEEAPRYDSALTYYKKVLNDYPYSTYAMALRPRFAEAAPQTSLTRSPAQRTAFPDQRQEPGSPNASEHTPINRPDMPQRPGMRPQQGRPFAPQPGQPPLPPGVKPPPLAPITPPNMPPPNGEPAPSK